jgi:hypothetical protein
MADPTTTGMNIHDSISASIDTAELSTRKDIYSAAITFINANAGLLNVWFNLSLATFTDADKEQLFLALDSGSVLDFYEWHDKLTLISDEVKAATGTHLLPLIDVRAIDADVIIDRLTAHSLQAEFAFHTTSIVLCHTAWTPNTSTIPGTQYTLLDVYNDVYGNVPNYNESHGERLIWNINNLRKSGGLLYGLQSAEWDESATLISTLTLNELIITEWVNNNISSLTIPLAITFVSRMAKVINSEIRLMNTWFDLSLYEFDKTNLLVAIESGHELSMQTELAYFAAVAHSITDYAVPMLEPLVNITSASTVIVDRLTEYSTTGYTPNTIVTSPWFPAGTTSVII